MIIREPRIYAVLDIPKYRKNLEKMLFSCVGGEQLVLDARLQNGYENTYGHLYPSEQEKMAEMLDRQWSDSANATDG